MRISNDYPPNFREIEAHLGRLASVSPVFCFGDVLYNPYRRNITSDIEAHEEVHLRQQGISPEGWWYKYLRDKEFRLEQEVEAYRAQYQYAKEHGVRGKLLDWAKEKMAMELSGEAYGTLIPYGEAISKIRH